MATDRRNEFAEAARTRRGADAARAPTDDERAVASAKATDAGHLRRDDPSRRAEPSAGTRVRGGEVAWVRVSDVLAQRSGRVAGRGITWTTTANRWPRLAPVRSVGTGRRAIDRATTARRSRLAPLDAFGARQRSRSMGIGVAR